MRVYKDNNTWIVTTFKIVSDKPVFYNHTFKNKKDARGYIETAKSQGEKVIGKMKGVHID